MKKTNNKGFSLVELIIVIAIMAVLVGILAPQFIKYVEKSRESTDIKNVQEMVVAIQVYAADPDGGFETSDAGTITLGAAAGGKLATALTEAGLPTTYTAASTKYENTIITVSIDTNGAPSFTAGTSSDTSAYNDDFGF